MGIININNKHNLLLKSKKFRKCISIRNINTVVKGEGRKKDK